MQRLSVPYTSRYNKKYKIMNIAINSTQKSFGVLQLDEWYTCQEFKWKMEKCSWTSTYILYEDIVLCDSFMCVAQKVIKLILNINRGVLQYLYN